MAEENGMKKTNQVAQFILAALTIFSLLFGAGYVVLARVNTLDRALAVECQKRESLEKTVTKMDEKLDKILDKLSKVK